jgi:hypothetical protein
MHSGKSVEDTWQQAIACLPKTFRNQPVSAASIGICVVRGCNFDWNFGRGRKDQVPDRA